MPRTDLRVEGINYDLRRPRSLLIRRRSELVRSSESRFPARDPWNYFVFSLSEDKLRVRNTLPRQMVRHNVFCFGRKKRNRANNCTNNVETFRRVVYGRRDKNNSSFILDLDY